MAQINITTAESQKKINELITRFRELKTEITGISNGAANFRKLNTALKELDAVHKSLTSEVVRLKKELKNMSTSQKSFVTQTRNLKKENDGLTESLRKSNRELEKTSKATKKVEAGHKGLISVFKNVASHMLAFVGITMFAQSIKETFELAKKLDSLNFALLAITKSQEASAQSQAFLARITKAYGADIVSTTERYTRFLAAAKQSNVTLKDTQQIFETMTKVSGVLGLNTTDLTGIFLALEQMLSKGKVTTEELRRQLGERLPGAMGIMATSLGVTIPQLDEMLKKGQILSAEVLPEFARQVELSFGITNVSKVETLTAAWARMKNKFVEIFSDFSAGTKLSKQLSNVIDLLSKNMGNLLKATFIAIKAFLAYKTVISILSFQKFLLAKQEALVTAATKIQTAASAAQEAQLKGTAVATINLRKAWSALMVVMKANWIGVLAVAIGAAYAAFEYFSSSIEETAKAMNKSNNEFIESQYKAAETSKSINNLADSYDKLSSNAKNAEWDLAELNYWTKENEKAQAKLKSEIEKTGDSSGVLRKKLRELHNENVDLKTSTLKLKDEQEELDRVTRALAKAFPDAVSAQNDYGDATGINTVKVREMNKELEKTALLKAKVNSSEQIGLIQQLAEKQKKLDKDVIERQQIIDALRKSASAKFIKDEENKLLKFRETADANRQLLIATKLQKQANDDLIYSYSATGKMEAALAEAKAKADAQEAIKEKEKQSLVRNEINLNNEITELEKERSLLAKDTSLFIIEDGKYTSKTHATRIDEINKEIEARQKLIDAIQNKKEKGGSSKKAKIDTTEIDLKISASKRLIEIQDEITENEENSYKERLVALETSNNEKFNLMELEYDKEVKQADGNKNQLLLIEQEHIYDRLRINEELQDKLEALQKSEVDRLTKSVGDDQLTLENERNTRILEARTKFVKGSEELKKAELEINNDIDGRIIQGQIELGKKIITIFKEMGVSTETLEALLLKLEVAFGNIGQKDKVKASLTEILETVQKFSDEIANIGNALFDRKIENIEAEIEATNEKYDSEIAMAEGNEQQQKDLALEKEARIKILEKQRLKEQQKQAKFNKAMALADIAMNTAVAYTAALKLGPILGIPMSTIVLALGALQTAAVLAQPIPKYKDGSPGIKTSHIGMINDGGKQEYIERGGELFTAEGTNALVGLQPKDIIHKDFDSLKNNSNFIKGYDDVSERDIMMFTAYNKSHLIQKQNLDNMMIGITKSIDKGFKKVKINNTIENQMMNNYGESLSRWN